MVGDLEAEVGRVAGDVPVGEAGVEPLAQLVGRLLLHLGGQGPARQELHAARVGQAKEEVVRLPALRLGAGNRRVGRDEFSGLVGGPADLAGVAVLVLGVAFRAFALDEPVRQKHLFYRVEELLDGTHLDEPRRLQLAVDVVGVVAGFIAVGGVVVVKVNVEAVEIRLVLVPDPVDQGLGRDPVLLGPEHDRGAMGVVGAHVPAFVAPHLLEPGPDVRLDVLHEVPDVDGAVGVGQRAGDEYFSLFFSHDACRPSIRKISKSLSHNPPVAGDSHKADYFGWLLAAGLV